MEKIFRKRTKQQPNFTWQCIQDSVMDLQCDLSESP